MKHRLFATLVLLLGLLSLQEAASAQGIEVGAHAGYDFDFSDLFIGANAMIPIGLELGGSAIDLNADASFWVTGDGYNVFAVDANLIYPFSVDSESFAPYAGAGLVLVSFSSDVSCEPFCDLIGDIGASSTDIGLNIKGGSEFGSGNIKPFGEVGIYLKSGSQLYVQGGARLTLGGS